MLLEAKNISFKYSKGEKYIFEDLNLTIKSGEIIGLIGNSGLGKTTLCKVLAGYEKPSSGEVLLDRKKIKKGIYNPVQLIYQHPDKAMNPRWKMRDILNEGGPVKKELLESLGIEMDWLERYPSELSGGELSRFQVCRALGERTKFLIADEITAMLDAITQAQIWNVILKESKKRNIGVLVISHNTSLAEKITDKVISLKDI
ncbi:MAG: ATP-binding cassette domain-containing protein [Clostridium sp.]|nr:ATP-binding cassette domain-containing protein [Clostridium sp.]